jgi:hypothetical protein
MTIHINIYLDVDLLDADGSWRRSWTTTENGFEIQRHTLASRRWRGIQNRCNPGGHAQKRRPSYVGCSNGFKDFQEFAEWCQSQPGYADADESGSPFHLDKDILSLGNKRYSEETCCFVPARINQLLSLPRSPLSTGLPVGCSYHKRTKRFYSCIAKPGGGTKYLGYFSDPMGAHHAWQKAKADRCRFEAERLPPDFFRVSDALVHAAQVLEENIRLNREFTI